MDTERLFIVPINAATAYLKIRSYFVQKGYKHIGFNPNMLNDNSENIRFLNFKYGSGFSSFFSFNPEHWERNIHVKITPQPNPNQVIIALSIELNANVNEYGPRNSPEFHEKDMYTFYNRYLESEAAGLESALINPGYKPLKNKTRRDALKTVLYTLVIPLFIYCAIAVIVVIFLADHFTGSSDTIVGIGFGLSAVISMLLYGIWHMLRKRLG